MSPRKRGVEPLARERIVEAAVRIIAEEGLGALSMRRLGAVLGVNPMAPYYHVPNKAALYDLVLEALMADVDLSGVDDGASLSEQVKQAARTYRAAVLAHPRAIPVLAMRSLRTAAALRPVEPLLGILYAAGLSPSEALAAVDCIAQYILGGTVGFYHHVVDSETTQQLWRAALSSWSEWIRTVTPTPRRRSMPLAAYTRSSRLPPMPSVPASC